MADPEFSECLNTVSRRYLVACIKCKFYKHHDDPVQAECLHMYHRSRSPITGQVIGDYPKCWDKNVNCSCVLYVAKESTDG